MKKELIEELFNRFENACYLLKSVECWSARDLQEIFGYTEWRNFIKVIEKAKNACENAGGNIGDHFVDVNKMVGLGSKAERNKEDLPLSARKATKPCLAVLPPRI